MNIPRSSLFFLALSVLVMAILSCNYSGQPASETGEPTRLTPEQTARPSSTPVPRKPLMTATQAAASASPTATSLPPANTPATEPTLEPTAPPAPTEVCEAEVCNVSGFLVLQRPIGGDGRKAIDISSRFGIYRASTDDTIRGVYFLNSTGTSVLAAADGSVVVAGDDSDTAYGSFLNEYGNLVILEHQLPGITEPVFTLYAHLSQISVAVGDAVSAGEEIGLVGSSGDIAGSTLLFEVRIGENSLQAARNPELWLAPLSDESGQAQGALAGRILDGERNYVSISNIVIERLSGPGQPTIDQFYLQTYSDSDQVGLSPYAENFALGDLPAGQYQVTVYLNAFYQQEFEIRAGEVTVVTLTIP